jgi:predicted metal-dependent peptidase
MSVPATVMAGDDQLEIAKKALSRVKIELMRTTDTAFFCSVALSLRHEFSYSIPTAMTDGLRVWYNPNFFNQLTLPQQLFLFLHETMHVAYLHCIRGTGLDEKKFNYACDYVINAQLIERGFEMPPDGLYDEAYKGLSAEEVYRLLPDEAPCSGSGSGTGLGNFGSDLKPGQGNGDGEQSGPDGMSAQDLERKIGDILVRAQIQSQLAGEEPGVIPGEIEVFINKLLNPKLPWHRILQRFMNSFNKTDYSFRKPNRRYFPNFILPSLHSEALGEIVQMYDMSGSVEDHETAQYASEAYAVMTKMKPEKLTLIQFDTDIKSIDEIRSVQDLMNVKFKGRGGTCIKSSMEWAAKNRPQVVILFSDGHFDFYDVVDPRVPVIWVIHNNPQFEAPFGQVIHFEIDRPK